MLIIIYMIWAAAYFCFAVSIELLADGDIVSFFVGAFFSIWLWVLGYCLFRKATRSEPSSKYLMICLLAPALLVCALALLGAGDTLLFIVLLVIAAINLYVGVVSLRREKRRLSGLNTALDQQKLANQTEDEKNKGFIIQVRRYVQRLRQLRSTIPNDPIANRVIHLETISQQILEFIETHPNYTGKLHKFTEYYFPTAIKFLEKYVSFSKKPVKSENIKESLEKTSQGLISMEKAFEQLLNNLYEDKVMDMDSELALLQQTMAIEGLDTKEPF